MPAAKNRNDLIAVTEKEWGKLASLLDRIEAAAAEAVVVEGWSARDILVHRANWIDLFLGWYRDGQAGHEVHFPAPGYKWNDLKSCWCGKPGPAGPKHGNGWRRRMGG